jgi:hypothetical protein
MFNTNDQDVALSAGRKSAKVDAKVLRQVGIKAIEGIVDRKGQGDMGERINPWRKRKP